MNAIIIDDEPQARLLLKGMLQMYCPDIEILPDCADLPSGIKAIRKLRPELVFLDIEMPQHSGLEILDFFGENEVNFAIIFTTAYHQYAIQAFKLSALDYLLKPIEPDELKSTIERYKKRTTAEIPPLRESIENMRSEAPPKIAIPTASGIKLLEFNSIVYLRAENSYTELFLLDGSKILVSRTLKGFEDAFSGNNKFFRCHKSYIVNTDYITEYVKKDGGTLMVQDKHSIPISSDKVQEFLSISLQVKR